MELWKTSDDFASLAERRGVVAMKIERLLLIRSLIGEWNPQCRADYQVLCEEERVLIERMNELRLALV